MMAMTQERDTAAAELGDGQKRLQIIDGARSVSIFGDDIPVRARIHTINGFSAHADQNELLAWHGSISGKRATFLVHGEFPVMTALASRLQGSRIEIPRLHQSFEL